MFCPAIARATSAASMLLRWARSLVEETAATQVGEEAGHIGGGTLLVDVELLAERRDQFGLGARLGQALPQHARAAVQLEVHRPREVEDDDLVAGNMPCESGSPELHDQSSAIGDLGLLRPGYRRKAHSYSIAMADDVPYVMSPTEILLGFMPGYVDARQPPQPSTESPREVLERVVRQSLRRGPCGVAFSGGRDSSTVLAIATHVARREGLPEPVPITRRFPGITEAEESEWQERVVHHLGLQDWHRITLHDEVDAVGPLATARLARYGVLWPPNLAGDVPMIEAVPGGSVIDGEGGDEVIGDDWHRIAPVQRLLRSRPLQWRRLRSALGTVGPAGARVSRIRRTTDQTTWLTAAGREIVLDAMAREERARPLRLATALRMIPRKRKQVLAARNRRLLAAQTDVEVTSPLLHPDFIESLARRSGTLGLGNRSAVLRELVPDLLPDEVLTRTGKGQYTRCYMGGPTQRFAAGWSGDGVDAELVRAEELKRLWASGAPAAPTAALLQAAWLATAGRSTATEISPSPDDCSS